jgi:cytochrome c-type biogenesis protein
MRKWIFLALAVALAVALACSRRTESAAPNAAGAKAAATTGTAAAESATAPAGEVGTEIGSAMPAFAAKTLDGGKFDVASERGQVVFLNLWATWCGPCRYEIPELEALHKQYAARGFKVVGVSLDESGADAVKAFVTEHKMTYPIVLDPEGHLADLFKTSVIPTSVVIDRSGKIVWKKFGIVSTTDESLKKALEEALAKG